MQREERKPQFYYDASITHRRNLSKLETIQSTSNVNSFISLQSPIQRKLSESNALEKNILSSRGSMHRMIEHYSKNYDLIQHSDHFEMITDIQPQISPTDSIKKITDIDIKHDGSLYLQELKSNSVSTIQITRFRFNYFYVRIYEKESPIQAYIKSESSKLSTFKMYVSTVAQFPTSFNCELAVQSKYFKFSIPHSVFHVKNLYIAMYSEEDCVLQITFFFGHNLKKKIKLVKEEANLEKYKLCNDCQYLELNALSASKLEQIKTDKITFNLNTKQYTKDKIEQRLKLNQKLLDRRISQALEKKKIIYEDKKLDILCRLQANDSLKEIRNAQKQLEFKQRLLTRNQVVWIEIVCMAIYVERIHEMLNVVIQIILQMKLHNKYLAKGRLMVWQYKTITMIKVKGTGQTVEERSRFKLCLSICLLSKQLKLYSKNRAVKTVMAFMHATHLYMQCLIKHRYFVDKGNSPEVFRNLKMKNKAFRDRLWRQLQKNGQTIMLELTNKQNSIIKKRQYHIDHITLTQIMDKYITEKKQKWQKYIQNYISEKSRKKKVLDLTLSLMQPEMFNTPTYDDLVEIYKMYAEFKNITIVQQ